MSASTLESRDYEYVPQDDDNKVVHCYIVENGTRASNPLGIFTLTSTNNYQTKLRITGEESVISSNLTLANAKTLFLQTVIAMGALPAEAADVDVPTSIVITSDAEDDTVFIPVSGQTTCQLSAECLPEGVNQTVTWSVQGAPVTGVSVNSSTGLATFLSTTAVATATFVATSTVAGGVTDTIVITCTQV